MTAYVLDSSVAAKWFLPPGETLVNEALGILDEYAAGTIQLLVPDLFWAEIGNILSKAVRTGRMSKASAEKAIGLATSHAIPTAPSFPLLGEAFAIATNFQRSVYDSIYVALALDRARLFLTADERLANSLAGRLPVRWLGTH